MLLVVLAHADVPRMKGGGNTGVTLFFVLSGFLITTLLLEESDRTGRISFRGFYVRRARRLLPAAFVTVGAVAVIGLVVDGFTSSKSTLGALFYFNNWNLAVLDYEASPNALTHTWSLSVEEQFYFVAPLLVLALRRRPRALLVTCVLGVIASATYRLSVFDDGGVHFGHAYYDTLSRVDGLLVGVALATAVRLGVHRVRPGLLASGTIVVGLACFTPKYTMMNLGIMPTVVALCAVPLILHGVGGSTVLEARGLRWVGKRSYGIYLYHYPVVVLLNRIEVPWPVMLAVTTAGSLGLAALSWRLLEQPILLRGRHARQQSSRLQTNLADALPRLS